MYGSDQKQECLISHTHWTLFNGYSHYSAKVDGNHVMYRNVMLRVFRIIPVAPYLFWSSNIL